MTAALDLFAGPGGWSVALRRLGIAEHAVELDEDACTTRRAAGLQVLQADVRALSFSRTAWTGAEGLIASPPCQTFSSSGSGTGRRNLDRVVAELGPVARGALPYYASYDDARTGLVLEPMRYAAEAMSAGMPYRWIVLEQVPQVLPVWQEMAHHLRDWGYSATSGILHAEQYGVPQSRKRAFMVAVLDGVARLPEPTHSRFYSTDPGRLDEGLSRWVSMREALGWDAGDLVGFPRRADDGASVSLGGVDYRARDLRTADLPSFTLTSKARSWLRFGMRGGGTEQLHRSTSHPAPTLAFGRDSASWCWADTVDKGVRTGTEANRITEAEAGVLQSFPADYPWTGKNRHSRYGQVANAVPPLLAEAVLRSVLA